MTDHVVAFSFSNLLEGVVLNNRDRHTSEKALDLWRKYSKWYVLMGFCHNHTLLFHPDDWKYILIACIEFLSENAIK